MHSPRFARLHPSFFLLGALGLRCAPPVATLPAPTPVYTEELNVEPIQVTRQSLRESDTSWEPGTEESTPPAAGPGEEDPPPEASEIPDGADGADSPPSEE